MDALAARELGEALELLGLEPVARLLRGSSHFLPTDAFAGVEIEHDPIAKLQAAQL